MIATDAQLISFAAFSFSFFQSTSCVSKPFNFQCSVQRVGGSKAGLHRERKRNKQKEDQVKWKQVAYVRHAEKQGELLVNLFVLLLFACPLYHTYTHKTTPLCPHFLSLTLTVLLIDATDVHREINNLPAPPTPTPPQSARVALPSSQIAWEVWKYEWVLFSPLRSAILASDCVKTPAPSCWHGCRALCHESLRNKRFYILVREKSNFWMCCSKTTKKNKKPPPQVIKSSALKQLSCCFGNRQSSLLRWTLASGCRACWLFDSKRQWMNF